MAYVVTGRCVNCRYTYCVVECPVACFWELTDPRMVVIDPGTCTDCGACVSACPIHSIWPDHEVPAEYAEWTAKNGELFAKGTNITEGTDPLESAKLIGEIQAEEKAKGWKLKEPSGAS